MLFTYAIIFIFGLVIGSFLNVVIFRLDRKPGLVTGRSECPKCLKLLQWYDLFPVLSYFLLRGRCRYCRKEISAIYPVVELTTAAVLTSYLAFNGLALNMVTAYNMALLLLFTVLVFFDFLYFIIPDKIIILAASLALIYDIFLGRLSVYNFLASGFVFGAFFATIYVLSRGEWMGFGDVKLAFVIGLMLGYPLGFFAITISIWLAALSGILMILLKKATLKTALPFGSFLAAVSIVMIIFQNEVQKIQIIERFL